MDRERRDLSCSAASRCTWIHVRARSARDSVLVTLVRNSTFLARLVFSPFLRFRSVEFDISIDRSDYKCARCARSMNHSDEVIFFVYFLPSPPLITKRFEKKILNPIRYAAMLVVRISLHNSIGLD